DLIFLKMLRAYMMQNSPTNKIPSFFVLSTDPSSKPVIRLIAGFWNLKNSTRIITDRYSRPRRISAPCSELWWRKVLLLNRSKATNMAMPAVFLKDQKNKDNMVRKKTVP